MNKFIIAFFLLVAVACKQKKASETKETRTAGNLTILVDESVAPIVKQQIEIFNLDYPHAKIKVINRPEQKMLPAFLNDSVRVAVLTRTLSKDEEKFYAQRNIKMNASRFALDGIALITNRDNIDSTITVKEVIDILQGKNSAKKLVFDNMYSSTFEYFKQLAKISQFPKQGVYAKNSSNDVIKMIAEDKNYIGVLGVDWINQNSEMANEIAKIKFLGVKNLQGGENDKAFYKPTQNNLINGLYPFRRNIHIYDCEGRDGLGTGFATWLRSQRGQLIVLKSGLAPHKLMPREINLIKK